MRSSSACLRKKIIVDHEGMQTKSAISGFIDVKMRLAKITVQKHLNIPS
jgi:hypothetical protein